MTKIEPRGGSTSLRPHGGGGLILLSPLRGEPRMAARRDFFSAEKFRGFDWVITDAKGRIAALFPFSNGQRFLPGLRPSEGSRG